MEEKSAQESNKEQLEDQVIEQIIIKEFCEKLSDQKKEKCVDFYVGSKEKEGSKNKRKE